MNISLKKSFLFIFGSKELLSCARCTYKLAVKPALLFANGSKGVLYLYNTKGLFYIGLVKNESRL